MNVLNDCCWSCDQGFIYLFIYLFIKTYLYRVSTIQLNTVLQCGPVSVKTIKKKVQPSTQYSRCFVTL